MGLQAGRCIAAGEYDVGVCLGHAVCAVLCCRWDGRLAACLGVAYSRGG